MKFRLIMSISLLISCSADDEPGRLDANLFVAEKHRWPSPVIQVCWENPGDGSDADRTLVQNAAESTWGSVSTLDFVGWGTCPVGHFNGIRITIDDVHPKAEVGVDLAPGIDCCDDKNRQYPQPNDGTHMWLNFTFDKHLQNLCQNSNRDYCIRVIAIHEFGHAIGFDHEQNRPDTRSRCKADAATIGDRTLGPWDKYSVMNYCSPKYAGDGYLSAIDIAGVIAVYGRALDLPAEFDFISHFYANQSGWDAERHLRLMGDVNADGVDDVVGFGDDGVWVALGTADSFRAAQLWSDDFGFYDGWVQHVHLPDGGSDQHVRLLADVNDDGRKDIVGFREDGVHVALAQRNGRQFHRTQKPFNELTEFGPGWRADRHIRTMADVNADGADDIVGFHDDGVYVSLSILSSDSDVRVSFRRPELWIGNFGYAAGAWRLDRHPRMMADVDNDGSKDIVGFGEDGVYVARSTGSRFEGHLPAWIGTFGASDMAGQWRSDRHVRTMADVNADGMQDIVGFGYEGVFVALSTGNGFTAHSRWINDFGFNAGEWRTDKHLRMMADVNGDGMQDIVAFGNEGVWIAESDGNGFGVPELLVGNYGYDDGWRVDLHPRMVANVDGNPRMDLVAFGETAMFTVNN